MPRPHEHRAGAGLVAVALIWGGAISASSAALEGVAAVQQVALRFAAATLTLAVVLPTARRTVTGSTLVRGLGLGLLLATGFLLQTSALETTSVVTSAFLTGTVVVFAPVIAMFWGGTGMSGQAIIGVLLATADGARRGARRDRHCRRPGPAHLGPSPRRRNHRRSHPHPRARLRCSLRLGTPWRVPHTDSGTGGRRSLSAQRSSQSGSRRDRPTLALSRRFLRTPTSTRRQPRQGRISSDGHMTALESWRRSLQVWPTARVSVVPLLRVAPAS